MKYIELILDSLSSKAALQTALEDACVARWGLLPGQPVLTRSHTTPEQKGRFLYDRESTRQ